MRYHSRYRRSFWKFIKPNFRVRKIAKSDYLLHHVCLYIPSFVRMEQLGSHWTDFRELLYLSIFQKICWENASFIKIWQEWGV